jgi:hypothetical protein
MSIENLFTQPLVTGEKIVLRNEGTGIGPVARKDDVGFAFKSIKAGAGIVVKQNGDDIVITNSGTLQQSFLTLTESPANFTGANGKFLSYNSVTGKLEFAVVPPQYGSMLDLSDTPTSYSGMDHRYLRVDAPNNKVIFYDLEANLITPLTTRVSANEVAIGILQNRKIVTIGTAPPLVAVEGDFWFNAEDGSLYIAYGASPVSWIEVGSAEPVLPPVTSYDYGGTFEGTPTANQVIYRWRPPVAHTLKDEFAGCTFTCDTAPTATFSCQVFVGGVHVGDWHISTAKNYTLITLGTEVTVPANTEVKIVAPAVPVTGISGIMMAFIGDRQQ